MFWPKWRSIFNIKQSDMAYYLFCRHTRKERYACCLDCVLFTQNTKLQSCSMLVCRKLDSSKCSPQREPVMRCAAEFKTNSVWNFTCSAHVQGLNAWIPVFLIFYFIHVFWSLYFNISFCDFLPPQLQVSPQCTFCLFLIKKLEDMLPKERTEVRFPQALFGKPIQWVLI